MLIPRKSRSEHWYFPSGEPCYEVPRADGKGLRATTIKDARKLGLFRSVTKVLSVLAKPGLVNWQIEQGILAALTLPRRPAETEHEFATRALADSENQVNDAASAGTRLHDAAAEWLVKGTLPSEHSQPGAGYSDAALLAPFMAWAQQNIARTIYSEKVVVNPALHYAGRLDAFIELKAGGYAVLDLKSQDVALNAKGEQQPAFYDEWPLQLDAYAKCEALQFWTPANHRLLSGVIDRNRPGFWAKEWPASAEYFDVFAATCKVWNYQNKGTPGKDAN